MKDESLRLLMIENSEDDALLIIRNLKKGGYNPLYERVETAAAMKKALKEKQWDIILCDYKMPKFSGPSAIAILKDANIDIPLIVVTGTVGEEEAAECMRSGAQDYIMKGNLSRLCPAIARELEDAKIRSKEKRLAEALRKAALDWQITFEATSDSICLLDTEQRILRCNLNMSKMFGMTQEEIIGRYCWDVVHGSTKPIPECPTTRIKNSLVREKMDIQRGDRWLSVTADPILDETRTLQGVVHIMRDITERKRAEEKLRESEEKYRLIFENSPLGLLSFDEEGFIVACNDNFVKIIGSSHEKLIGLNMLKLPDKEMVSVIKKALNGSPGFYEGDYSSTTAKKITPVRCLFKPMDIGGGRILGGVGIIEDITERKRAEQDLRESEYKYKSLIENIPDIIFTIDLEGRVTFISRRVKEILGYENEETINKNIFNFIPEEHHQRALESLQKGMKGEKIKNFQIPMIAKSGGRLYFECSFSRIYKDGVVVGAQGTAVNITERKGVEAALRESEVKYRTLFESANDTIFLMDYDIFIDCNQKTLVMFGCTREQIIGQAPYRFSPKIQPDGRNSEEKALEKINAAIQGNPQYFEWQHCRYDGTLFDTEISLNAFNYKGKYYVQSIVRDITERKKAEETIKNSEAKYRNIFENAIEGIYQSTIEGRFITANAALARMAGYDSPEELIESIADIGTQLYVYPQNRKRFLEIRDAKGFVDGFEVEFYKKDGSTFWVVINARTVKDEQGKILYVEGLIEDITIRKYAEDDLRESEGKFNAAFNANPISTAISTIEDGRFINVNDSFMESFSYSSKAEIIGKTSMELGLFVNPLDRQSMREKMEETGRVHNIELKMATKDGRILDILFSAELILVKNKQCLLSTALDITDRKRAEEQLHRTLESLRKAVGTTIQVLGTASETRDPYTAGHQKRVAQLARAIATEMGLPDDKIEGLRMAGSIHDIGKISIPAEILSKPTKLTNTEFSIIKEHSEIGYNMLKDVESPWPLAEIVYQHHERMNGSGYPRNLKGNEILLEARILAVAHVVEAMGSHRPYRPTLGTEAALEEITKNKGILYDNTVADACLKLFREKGYQLA